jgi:phosphotriesterase-related protein
MIKEIQMANERTSFSRRFCRFGALIILSAALSNAAERLLITTTGPIDADAAGLILPHEHIFTDLRGPDRPGYGKADREEVIRVMKPLLVGAKSAGVNTLIECTTIGVGRNVPVVAELASESGLHIVVPTGVYGRAQFAPKRFAEMSENDLARWMTQEIVAGIEGTGVKAGFIKTAASETGLQPLEEKFLRASARASRQTGVAIASHTTSGEVARNQVNILEELELPLDRFVWVHAQAEGDTSIHEDLARRGAYIELDSVGSSPEEDEKILKMIRRLIDAKLQDRILVSHDAGWYNPGQPNGGKQRGYTQLTREFLPKMKKAGVNDALIRKITEENPFRAFSVPAQK